VVGKKVETYEDLEVYQKLVELHLEVHQLTLQFPSLEKYELGSQVRRSSNACAANLAEGWNNKHVNIYLEGINRALGELRETRHHLQMAFRKGYLTQKQIQSLLEGTTNAVGCCEVLRGRWSVGRKPIELPLPPSTFVLRPRNRIPRSV